MSRIRPDTDAELGQVVRRTIWRHADRLSGSTGSRDKQMIALAAQRHPGAVAALGRTAIVAAMREVSPGRCCWDAYRMLTALNDEPAPSPTPGLLGLLGQPCVSCTISFEAAAVARRERPHVDQVIASGLQPIAAGRLRTPGEVADYAARLRRLDAAKLPPQPPPITQRRRSPDPPYYERRSWPVGAVR